MMTEETRKTIESVIVVLGIAIMLAAAVRIMTQNKAIVKYDEQVETMQACIDSLETVHQTDMLLMKVGEYHVTSHCTHEPISKDSVASLLSSINAWYPDIIMAQVQMESGFGVSDLALNANNVLGMKKASKRKTTQIRNKSYKGYGVYNNWEACVIDRVLWDYSMFGHNKPSREVYVAVLNRRYGQTGTYGGAIDTMSRKYKNYFEENAEH